MARFFEPDEKLGGRDPQKFEEDIQDILEGEGFDTETVDVVMKIIDGAIMKRIAENETAYPDEPTMSDVEHWAAWSKAGETAAKTACDRLIEQGIGYVYGREGRVYRRNPDGSETEIETAKESRAPVSLKLPICRICSSHLQTRQHGGVWFAYCPHHCETRYLNFYCGYAREYDWDYKEPAKEVPWIKSESILPEATREYGARYVEMRKIGGEDVRKASHETDGDESWWEDAATGEVVEIAGTEWRPVREASDGQ